MKLTTKERILNEALVMFANNGYNGTNLRDLAANLGLSKSALYKHYASKEDIFNELVLTIEDYYHKKFGSFDDVISPNSTDELIEMSLARINFTIHDEKIKLIRKMLLTEQFRNEKISKLATLHISSGVEEMHKAIFTQMIKKGLIKPYDASLLAMEFSSPVSILVQLIDREPHKEQMAMDKIKAHFEHFVKVYGVN